MAKKVLIDGYRHVTLRELRVERKVVKLLVETYSDIMAILRRNESDPMDNRREWSSRGFIKFKTKPKTMKTLAILFLFVCQFTHGQQLPQKSRYEKGFSYFDGRGTKVTLVEWVKVGSGIMEHYRWKTRNEFAGITFDAWSDDCWIDLYTGKCFLNERTHQMVYYDSVDIIPKSKRKWN